jgi:serine/threonine-protein kinase
MDQMLDLPAPERADWVRGLAGTEADMAPQLLTLLQTATNPRSTAWMDTLPKMADAALYTLMQTGAGYEDVGDEIGPYRLVRLVARGGMGSVWYAERSDRLMRRGVALKLPLGNSKQLAARFEREREIVASLVHPHIARLYDAGISASGQAYLALEYVEGQTFVRYCDDRRLGLTARIGLFAQVLSAVQYAHSRLVIHRDIKPTNILVTNEGEVRLLDFGVAKMLDTETPGPSELTQLGDAGMTLAYASPEQVAGRPVTTSTDVYSLGVVLYELLVGVRPYRVARDTRGALEEAILQADIPLPSSLVAGQEDAEGVAAARGGTIKKLRKELQGDLDAILLKALSRKSQDRYETAASFADDLERHRNGRVVRAHRRSRWYQLQKFVGRNRIGVGATIATAIALTTATGVALWQASEADRQAQVASNERDRAIAAEANRAAVDEFMSDLLLDAGRIGKPISVTALIARADELSARQFADQPEVRAAVLRSVGSLELEFNGPEKALENFEQAEKMVANSRDAGLRASLACDRALLLGVSGQMDIAAKTLDAVAADHQTPIATASLCLGNRAQLAAYYRDGTGAARAAQKALTMWDLAPMHSPMRRLELLTFQAEAEYLNGEPGKADAGFAQVMGELKRMGRDRGELAETVRNYRTIAAISTGDPRMALALIDETINILARDVPDRPPPILTLYHRSMVASDLGLFNEALKGFEEVARLTDSESSSIAQRALLDSAVAWSRLGQFEEAERKYRQAVDVANHEPASKETGDEAEIGRRLVRAQLDLDRKDYPAVRRNLDVALKLNGPPSSIASMHRLRALAELPDGDMEGALKDSQIALDLSKNQRGDKLFSRPVGLAQLVLGRVLQARGDSSGARQSYDAAVEQLDHTVEAGHPDLIVARDLSRRLAGPAARNAIESAASR